MSKLFFALSNSAPGKDAEFNEWYDTHHVREVPEMMYGFVSGRRFKLASQQREGEGAGVAPPWQYLAIYQLEEDVDTARLHSSIKENPGRTVEADGTLSDDHVAWTWESIGPRVVDDGESPIAGDQQHVLLILNNPAPGREDEFNAWYDEHHLPEAVAKIDGRVAGQRYRLTEAQRQDQWRATVPGRDPGDTEQRPDQWLPWRYLTLYELQGDDVAALQAADAKVRRAGELKGSDGALAPGYAAWLYTALPDPAWKTPTPRTATGAPA